MAAIDTVRQNLAEARKNPKAFFKDEEVLARMRRLAHPDRFLDASESAEARAAFAEFGVLYDGIAASFKIGEYEVQVKTARGDLCDVYMAIKEGEGYILKRPFVDKAKAAMRKEAEAVKTITGKITDTTARTLLPAYVETVGETNVFRYRENLETLSSIMSRYRAGLDGRHVSWLLRRVLAALSWVHSADYVHGAITPDHILVDKERHGIVLIDWIHCGKEGSSVTIVPTKYKSFYPAQTVKDKKLTAALDVMMTARCLSLAADLNNTPDKVLKYLASLQDPANLKTNGLLVQELLDEFTRLLERVYGAPKFVELK